MSMQVGGPNDQSQADAFMANALDVAANSELDMLSPLRLTEATTYFADQLADRREFEKATARYLQAREQLLLLPTSTFSLAHSIYPGLIDSLTAQNRLVQAAAFEIEYLIMRATQLTQ